jgi:hypothetical protein
MTTTPSGRNPAPIDHGDAVRRSAHCTHSVRTYLIGQEDIAIEHGRLCCSSSESNIQMCSSVYGRHLSPSDCSVADVAYMEYAKLRGH